ncbi:histidine--tRNA ligase [Veillonella sp. YH-vei2232]|jgi:histidyl-tRNA synthetase|uniref:Histidine--tRNA ligase n=1 Tax=Veillonella absiana TaxID=3079305 RepID=A0ABU3Z9P3_9FIRM|nr:MULTISPECIES: histidine--tRNA ligase [unclassified Veillonella]MBP6922679.1 histidine--tRNA ligase [Veillonella sp.]MBP9551243.1 histidine--tRNA ligase [Veillonella sp.]MDV5063973.1 histidine--tRNA ligase [Veillonella sp. YH-vei2232]MDV5088609.1 histidine--tRNA ligase [Veillonella sp. YH-vei2233]
MAIRKPKGTQDFLPEQIGNWHFIEQYMRDICKTYGFNEIRTPVFEDTKLFLRGIGETTDVVQKEMYTFSTGDHTDQTFTLRPENTASAVRAYLENKVYGKEGLTKWFYIGPMFRHDKPQAGRYRQFHQFGAEVLGSQSPVVDSEVICMILQLLRSFGLQDLNVEVNSVGCPNCRPAYREKLIAFFEPKKEQLCPDCQERLYKNPLRILDCKNETCKDLSVGAPEIHEHLCTECHDHFEEVKTLLDAANVQYNLNPRLVRGLDYYTKTAFEVQYTPLGAQSAVAGGGRYDGLVEQLEGPSTPAIGFAMGMERLLLALEKQNLLPEPAVDPSVFVVALGDAAKVEAFKIVQSVREHYIPCEMDGQGKSMKAQLKYANKINAKYVIILGDDELANGEAIVRFMETSEQETVPLSTISEHITSLVKG